MTRGEMEEVKRYFAVVAEGLRSEIRIVAEGHGSLQASMDSLASRLDRLESKFEGFQLEVRADFRDVKERLGALESRPN
jgi:hypothetical protein